MPLVAISGRFDQLHFGHTRLIEGAAEYGNVVVILNTDLWLVRKKGYFCLPWDARAEILLAMRHVHNVIAASDDDGTVCETLKYLKPDFFANGGDRASDNTPELRLCADLGIKPLFNVGGDKVESSSNIVKRVNGALNG